ncbi:hypothetical protein [Brevibacillus sp. HB2.2]|uniref:hypothetical protein n=1 Tax=Brevibacillus sp. HB2.2 TaxID=2738846 RepID=UPI00156ABF0E|nr:hypothetical protein [Brevibacillus sp. HB2.2]NRS52133.1 hypothetical protein [Brevibacillus sp. HB2.2]
MKKLRKNKVNKKMKKNKSNLKNVFWWNKIKANLKNLSWWSIGTFLMTSARTILAFITFFKNE